MKERLSFILIGKSGCGKGTQSDLLSKYLKNKTPEQGVFYVQSGDEFRRFINGDSYTKKLARKVYDEGGLEPEFLSILMWTNFVAENYNGNDHIIIDGSPRLSHEALVMDSLFPFFGMSRPVVIYLNVSDTWATSRLLERGRRDDNSPDIKKRLEWFGDEVMKTVDFYRNNGQYRFIEVNGEQGSDKVHKEILEKLNI
jgi:adenylate kinase family enzyme